MQITPIDIEDYEIDLLISVLCDRYSYDFQTYARASLTVSYTHLTQPTNREV